VGGALSPGAFPLSGCDWSLCIGYFVFIFFLAWRCGRAHRSSADQYFVAGESLPSFAVGASMIVSTLSTEQMIEENGVGYFVYPRHI
jgi:solute:Na+ symporter, SSS family